MRATGFFSAVLLQAVQATGARQACWSPGSAALRASLTFKRANEAGLTGHPALGGLKWAPCPFVLYPACLFGAAKGSNSPPAHRLPLGLK